jgi:hypothetical protein
MAIRLPLFRPEPDPVDRIEIQTPCSVPWDSMYGDERIRHCGSCRKNVYNVAELTRAQALELIASREPVCLRIYRRPDGTVVTNDCWSRLRAARRRGLWALLVMLVIVAWAQVAAMFVGIAGLRRLVPHRAMDASTPAPAMVAPARPVPPQTPVVPDDRMIRVGEIAPPSRDFILDNKPPRRHKRATHPKGEMEDVTVLGGLIGPE